MALSLFCFNGPQSVYSALHLRFAHPLATPWGGLPSDHLVGCRQMGVVYTACCDPDPNNISEGEYRSDYMVDEVQRRAAEDSSEDDESEEEEAEESEESSSEEELTEDDELKLVLKDKTVTLHLAADLVGCYEVY